MDGELQLPPRRRRLPQRRWAETVDLAVNNVVLSATVGFDEAGRPAEIFLSGAKDGREAIGTLAAVMRDATALHSARVRAAETRS